MDGLPGSHTPEILYNQHISTHFNMAGRIPGVLQNHQSSKHFMAGRVAKLLKRCAAKKAQHTSTWLDGRPHFRIYVKLTKLDTLQHGRPGGRILEAL